MTTQSILEHHLQAFGSGDTAEILKDYTDDSVLVTQQGQLKGRAAIEEAFKGFFSGIFSPGTYEFDMDTMQICGDVAYIAWHATTKTHDVPLGTDTFVVRDGKIAVQTFAAQMTER